MKRVKLLPTVALISCLLLFSCDRDAEERAARLYVEADLLMREARAEAKNYSELYELYSRAGEGIERILEQYPTSDICLALFSGRARICDLSLCGFLMLEYRLKPLAKAEEAPFSCAMYLAEKIGQPPNKAPVSLNVSIKVDVLRKIAASCAEAGMKERAVQLLGEATQVTRTTKNVTKIRFAYCARAASGLVPLEPEVGKLHGQEPPSLPAPPPPTSRGASAARRGGRRSGKRKGWLTGSQPTTFTSGTRPLGSDSRPYLSDIQDN